MACGGVGGGGVEEEELWGRRGEGSDGELLFCLYTRSGVEDVVWDLVGFQVFEIGFL